MSIQLPSILKSYIEASNRHDVKSILSCFANDATVRDEGETLRGKEAIQGWLVKTIEKYKFQFKPRGVRSDNGETIVAVEVSGTFPGSPVTLDYHFTVENDKISALSID
jgi:ketosteroid isomerase-like protein